jgi:acetyl-CoA carboxylase biotin carboxyl carrier protein
MIGALVMELESQDIDEILKILDETPYDELTVRTSRFLLHLERGDGGQWTQSREFFEEPNMLGGDKAVAAATGTESAEEEADLEGRHAVRAPLPGTFYRAPSPGAAPFVEEGSEVEEDTVVCIVETMKLMNSVAAGVRGKVVKIAAENAEFAEKGQLLMIVEPAGDA